ncbi:hypothetical protein K457DRAFT_18541 [Linnemannia elongata AG-77]|uniref:Uncharacterized protein n=1 Tax=Linnemannia elongata AG-77 TaxID=1314771 RepID=A0A197K151_9FUNG|nr:hypothetical protein K457DRAFT_18541 [Linnemannia elongata AG-77]
MLTQSPNIHKVFKTNNNSNRSAGTLVTRIQDIHLAPSAAAEGSVNQSHTAAPLPAPEPRSEQQQEQQGHRYNQDPDSDIFTNSFGFKTQGSITRIAVASLRHRDAPIFSQAP